MAEFELIQILQIDATIITGILILLTIAQRRRVREHFTTVSLPKKVATVVVPFTVSAILALVESLDLSIINSALPGLLYLYSIIFMIVGFIYIIGVVLYLSKTRYD